MRSCFARKGSPLGRSDGQPFVPPKLYRIGEVMRYSGLSRQMVHNYTMMRLIREQERTESGHRLYGEDVFERLKRIEELKQTKTLREIQEILLAEEEEARDIANGRTRERAGDAS